VKNQVQLITYVDRLSGAGVKALNHLLTNELEGLFSGVHVLPFFSNIDGADAGFDPINHREVDPRLGTWDDMRELAVHTEVVADLIVNHCSIHSPEFQDFVAKGEASEYKDLFMRFSDVFPDGATETDILSIYRPRPNLPFTSYKTADGKRSLLWTTFTSEQIDIQVESDSGQAYLAGILSQFGQNGVKTIRLDAVGYAIKRPGTSCFMLPETFDFISQLKAMASQYGIGVLVEIHSYYKTQIEIAKQVDCVYDFALPPLVLHTLIRGNTLALKNWLEISPKNCITVLDTHDGIGIIDVGPSGDEPGLLSPEEIDELVEAIHENSRGQSRQATGAAASNLDLYQVNSTFYDALGQNDAAYLIARAIQFHCPGIPQVYYVGLLAGTNDMELLSRTKVGRDINRRYYGASEVAQSLEQPVVKQLIELIKLRNSHPAYQGSFSVGDTDVHHLALHWRKDDAFASLLVSAEQCRAEIRYSDAGTEKVIVLG